MKTDNAGSDSSSGATSASRPNPSNEPGDSIPAAELSEAEYLAQQAHNAQLAMARAWQEFKGKLGQGVDPKAWAQEHPWMAVGAAAVAGFVATTAIVPSREEQALKKLAAMERALHPAPAEKPANGDGKKEKGTLLGTILHEAFGLLRPVLASIVAANLGVPPQPSEPANASEAAPDQKGEAGI